MFCSCMFFNLLFLFIHVCVISAPPLNTFPTLWCSWVERVDRSEECKEQAGALWRCRPWCVLRDGAQRMFACKLMQIQRTTRMVAPTRGLPWSRCNVCILQASSAAVAN